MMHRLRRTLLAAGVLVGGLSLSPDVDAAELEPWTVIDLRPLPGADSASVADINEHGVSVGTSDGMPVRWDVDGIPTELAFPKGCDSADPRSISDTGYIAGHGACGDLLRVPLRWAPDGTVVSTDWLAAVDAVDANGIVVGYLYKGGFTPETTVQAYAWLSGHPILELPDAGAEDSIATDLTSWGYVVGGLEGVPTLPSTVAVGWYGDQVFPLLRTAASSFALAVNERGVALVESAGRGYLVAPGGAVTSLDSTGGINEFQDINDHGIVVGSKYSEWSTPPSIDDERDGTFYVGQQSVLLKDIVSEADADDFALDNPQALTNAAWVVGTDYDTSGQVPIVSSWLLKPPGD